MKMKQISGADIQIAPLILGGNVFGWTVDEKKSFEILDAFAGSGFNCIDTADVYSNWIPGNKGGESETIIGKWMAARGSRSKTVVVSKVGLSFQGEGGLKKSHIVKSIEGTLKRLQTDYLDVYLAHVDDPQTPLEESLEAFEELKKSGKVRAIGSSNYSAERLTEALKLAAEKNLEGYRILQPQYNLYDREGFEKELERVCEHNNLSVITYYSLASGFLTGKYRGEADLAKSPRGAGIKSQYLNERGLRILQALDEVAKELNATPTQVSLAWLLHRPSVTAPIVSATSVEQLQDVLKSAELKLNGSLLEQLNRASAW